MRLEDVMLREMSQPQKDRCCMIPHLWRNLSVASDCEILEKK